MFNVRILKAILLHQNKERSILRSADDDLSISFIRIESDEKKSNDETKMFNVTVLDTVAL
ncbi:MAG: hypothetical protein KIH03_07405 [Paludibacteraceae bacterium]|nr:hypothetical protein [Paludibacteraceae bacterium]